MFFKNLWWKLFGRKPSWVKIYGTPPEMSEKWEPILNKWLKEYDIQLGVIKVRLHSKPCGTMAWVNVNDSEDSVHLCVVRKNKDDIKFCFFHELKHIEQIRTGRLGIANSLMSAENSLELEASGFALELGIRPGGWIKRRHLPCLGYKYDKRLKGYIRG